MTRNDSTLRRVLAVLLCVSLLLGSVISLAEDAVANGTDNEGPKVYDFKLSQNNKKVQAGDKIKVSMKARDRSGINQLSAEFYNADADLRYAYRTVYLDYDPSTDRFVGETTVDPNWVAGTYVVNNICAYDLFWNSSNYYTYDGSTALGKFTVKETKSSKLKATVTIKENGKTLTPEQEINVEVELKNPKDADRIVVILKNDYREDDYETFNISCYKDPQSGKYIGSRTFGTKDGTGKTVCYYYSGKFELSEVRAYKDDGELIAKGNFSGQSVKLKGGRETGKSSPPKISSGKIAEKGKTLQAGATLHISTKIKSKAEITLVYMYLYAMEGDGWTNDKEKVTKYSNAGTIAITNNIKNKGNGLFETEYMLYESIPNGKYCLAIEACDAYNNWSWKYFDKQYFTFTDKDYVLPNNSDFVQQAVQAITGSAATDAQIQELGMLLAEGKANAVQIVKKIVEGAGLTQEEKVKRLAVFMKGEEPSADELARLVLLGDEALIDELSDGELFRELCNNHFILMGSFGRRKDGTEIGATPVKKVKLNKKKAELKVGKKLTLKATVTPNDATDTSVEWTSSDESVATVNSKGKVTAVSAGSCVITCKAKDGSGKKATCKITVKGDSANKNLKLSEEKLKLKVGETAKLKLADEDVEVKWSSSDKSVAKVNSKGKVTAIGKGKCTITCEAADGSTKIEIPVKVK